MKLSKLALFAVVALSLNNLAGCKDIEDILSSVLSNSQINSNQESNQISSQGSNQGSNQNSNNNSSTTNNFIVDWTSTTKDVMRSMIGEVLPVAAVSTNYTLDTDIDEDDNEYFIITDGNQVATFISTYGNKLTGYTEIIADYSEEYNCDFAIYSKEVSTKVIIVQLAFYYDDNTIEIMAGSGELGESGTSITDWTEETKTIMQSIIGEVLPVANLTDAYYVEEAYDEDSGESYFYIFDYGFSENILSDFESKLIAAGYEFDSDESDTDATYGDYYNVWYIKEKNGQSLIVMATYWYDDGAIEIFGWIDGGEAPIGGETPIDGETLTLTPSLIGTQDVGYVKTDGVHTVDGLSFTTSNVANQSVVGTTRTSIQFKAAVSALYNTSAWPAIQQIIVVFDAKNSGTLVVSAGNSASSLTTVSGSSGTYNLSGATFFKFEAQTTTLVESITFVFA